MTYSFLLTFSTRDNVSHNLLSRQSGSNFAEESWPLALCSSDRLFRLTHLFIIAGRKSAMKVVIVKLVKASTLKTVKFKQYFIRKTKQLLNFLSTKMHVAFKNTLLIITLCNSIVTNCTGVSNRTLNQLPLRYSLFEDSKIGMGF